MLFRSGNGGYITVAFAARELAPTTTGSMSGVLRWDAAWFAPRNGCQSFDIRATVQTGPVPMFTANAEAPTRPLGVFQATPSGASACAFTVSGLAAGWPNFLTARVLNQRAARRAGSSLYRVSFSLAGDGWDGRKVIPQPLATERNYIVARSIDATAIESADFSSKTRIVETRTNPRINPADRYAVHAVPRAAEVVAGSASDGTRLGDTVTLNPQPLPPKSDSVASTGIGQNPGAQSAIIIVGGRTNPLERKSPAAGPVFGTGVSPPVASRVQVQSAQEIDYGALAAKGPQIASQDPLANALRNVQTQGPVRLGFDIGMAVAEGQTASGPGKQRIFESLGAREHGAYEQQGFATAVSFSLQRNANAKLAATGAAIAEADDAAAAVRNAGPDVFYRLGFDIATGIFGDPALGALGNTAKGPGSLGIRNALSSAGQRGFDDSVAFHLSRKYKP